MSYRYEKTETGEDLVFEGFENGIANSPHKGIANIQNANISTETGEVMASFSRSQQSMTDTSATGSLAFVDTNHVSLSIANTNNLFKGNWITVTNSSHTGELPNGTYYVPPSTGSNFQLSNYYNAMNYTPATVSISTLVVGAGGGGGGVGSGGTQGAGGGGGGGQVSAQSLTRGINAYTVTIGAAGSGGGTGAGQGTNGGSSAFDTVTAVGGGGGGSSDITSSHNGLSGASGGGGGGSVNNSTGTGGTATAGNAGGNGASITNATNDQTGGGGGGAGTAGVNGNPNGGLGGDGVTSSISGASTYYGGGGGGSSSIAGGAGGTGGQGGGGAGGFRTTGTVGTVNTGGGGGAGSNGGTGVVIISYLTSAMTATGGTVTTSGSNTIHTFTTSGTFTITGIAQVTVPSLLTGFTAGLTANFTMVATMGKPLAQAQETYYASGVPYHRYYVLDANNLVWVYDDQNEVTYSASDNVSWFLPDYVANYATKASGIAVISGMLIVATEHGLFGKSVAMLGNTNAQTTTWVQFPDISGWQGSLRSTTPTHFCLTTHTGQLYITDNSYIVSLFPDSVLANPGVSTAQNVQSFCSWTVDPSDVTNKTGDYSIISGTSPVVADLKRVPIVFFTVNQGVLPTAITAGTVYYMSPTAGGTFNVYATAPSSDNTQLDIKTGASGPQYFNTFYPLASASASLGATPTYTLTAPQVALPTFEQAQCLAEIGTTILIGCKGNVVYPWNQIGTQASTIISLPEANVVNILTVNQMGYIFAGNKGNIYITDGSTASLVTSVPDYCAGIPGTPSTYIEPYFVWGGAAYIRGKVYFSILDQTATKAGNCGGIWSFVPTQNFYIGQDVGISLHIENQSSYGTYNGYSPIIITKQTQNAIAPQYWNAWWSNITGTTYGIDATGTGSLATSVAVIETDLVPAGTYLNKKTYQQIEYKVATPLLTGETVTMQYRTNATDAWTSCGAPPMTETNTVSGYYTENVQKFQWLQFRITLTPQTSSTGTFTRLTQMRAH